MDNANIFIFAKTSDWDEEQGNAPRIAILTYFAYVNWYPRGVDTVICYFLIVYFYGVIEMNGAKTPYFLQP